MANQTVCVVGAGTAGLEGLLSARERLGPDVELKLIAPEREFRYRPMSRDSLFRSAPEGGLAIADLVAHVGATWIADRAAAVREDESCVVTRDGDMVDFDLLLLAAGARRDRTLDQGYLWQRGGDPAFLDQIISELRAGKVHSVAVTVPRGARWPIPAYELALVLAWTAAATDARITLITAEHDPLAAMGPEATQAVTRELDAAGIHVIGGVEAVDAPRDHGEPSEPINLILRPENPAEQNNALTGTATGHQARERLGPASGSTAEFDRLISLPTVTGPSIAGVRTDAGGFIEVDQAARVCGSERVWAAGSCLAAALEHSALSARQADAAVEAMAAARGGATGDRLTSSPEPPELTGMLLTGQRERWLAENPPGMREPSTRCLWWPPGRAVGRMLAQRIAAWDPSVHEALPGLPDGLPIHAPVALGCTDGPSYDVTPEVSAEIQIARRRDIENRQLRAIQRRERTANAELASLDARLQKLARDQRRVVHELQEHGYLLEHDEATHSGSASTKNAR
jgi:sulfide:quinone oxidoreductase